MARNSRLRGQVLDPSTLRPQAFAYGKAIAWLLRSCLIAVSNPPSLRR